MPDQVGTVAIEVIDHGDDIAGPCLLMVAFGVGRLVAEPVAERVHAGHAVSIGQRIDEPGLLPGGSVHQQPMLQNDQRTLALHRIMNSVSAMNGKRHGNPPVTGRSQIGVFRAGSSTGTRRPNLSTTSPCFGQTSLAVWQRGQRISTQTRMFRRLMRVTLDSKGPPMQSTQLPKETDPHDVFAIETLLAAHAEKTTA